MIWWHSFVRYHSSDIEGAKYKIGQEVSYNHPTMGKGVGTIVAVNHADEFEYAIDSVDHWLLWESEISKVF